MLKLNDSIELYMMFLSKKIKDNAQTWDLYLNQALAAIRFNVNESTKFSPYFLLYNRDPVLPIDNILKPRRKYYGEEEHKIALQEQHKSFVLEHKHLKRAKKRQAKYANKNTKELKFEVGDPVYLKHHRKHNKLQANWRPYFRIIEKTSPAHAEHLRPALNIDEWEIPKDKDKRVLRATQYVVSPDQTESENSSENDSDNVPLIQIAKRFRRESQHSSSESDIPKMELSNKLKQKRHRLNIENEYDSDFNSEIFNQTTDIDYDAGNDNNDQSTDNDMSVNEIKLKPKKKRRVKHKSDTKQLVSLYQTMINTIVGKL
ncbi:unnamed protein product [Mytilus coruscus]|uniref:Integrase zinc-binding domain-containing protein n=1 Tax=Mytilus coruscus TaxID=42192 RepID=A0A6J8ALM7_MYTCO|nr:unnamed protein product [Mytilus coruscus]